MTFIDCAVLPADEKHSIPPGIKVVAINRATAVSQGLARYTGGKSAVGGAANAPGDKITFRLGIVCCKYDRNANDIV